MQNCTYFSPEFVVIGRNIEFGPEVSIFPAIFVKSDFIFGIKHSIRIHSHLFSSCFPKFIYKYTVHFQMCCFFRRPKKCQRIWGWDVYIKNPVGEKFFVGPSKGDQFNIMKVSNDLTFSFEKPWDRFHSFSALLIFLHFQKFETQKSCNNGVMAH